MLTKHLFVNLSWYLRGTDLKRAWAATFLSALLTACGGGGGGAVITLRRHCRHQPQSRSHLQTTLR